MCLRICSWILFIIGLVLSASSVSVAAGNSENPLRQHTVELQFPRVSTENAKLLSPDFGVERAQFRRAVAAISEGAIDEFEILHRSLVDYPIARYLRYLRLRHDFNQSPDKDAVAALNRFEGKYRDPHLTRKLTRHLQSALVDAEDWSLFLGVSKSRLAKPMHCAMARALSETGQAIEWTEGLTKMWISRAEFPTLCREALNRLAKDKLPGIKALWERIYKSIADGRRADTHALAAMLAIQDRTRVHAWFDARSNPSKLLTGDSLAVDDLLNRRILLDLLRRWSREDPPAAVSYWYEVREKYGFSADTLYDTDREMALRGAWLRLPQAYSWLYGFTVRSDDLEVMEWRVRSAIYAQDWKQALKSLKELPAEELAEDHWSYWHARALGEIGRDSEAEVIYQQVAQLPTYYGFLSADKLNAPYRIVDKGIDTVAEALERLRNEPGLIRAREYMLSGVEWEGRREWSAVLGDLSPAEVAATADLALEWGLPDRAIASANAAGQKGALAHRFPLAFQDRIEQAAARYDLQEDFIRAVARRESAFIPDIKSPAGAVGLMQLMPGTAKDVLRELRSNGRWDLKGRHISLTDAAANIDMGSYYLSQIGRRFGSHLALTASSYNAGPHRTRTWLPREDSVAADIWIDTIPFSETRRYVRAVLAYMTIFEWRRLQLVDASVENNDEIQSNADSSNQSSSGLKRLSRHLTPVRADADESQKQAEASASSG